MKQVLSILYGGHRVMLIPFDFLPSERRSYPAVVTPWHLTQINKQQWLSITFCLSESDHLCVCCSNLVAKLPGSDGPNPATALPHVSLFSITDSFESLVLKIIGALLTMGEKSPFYQSLLGANIGSEFAPTVGCVTNKQWYFHTSFWVPGPWCKGFCIRNCVCYPVVFTLHVVSFVLQLPWQHQGGLFFNWFTRYTQERTLKKSRRLLRRHLTE